MGQGQEGGGVSKIRGKYTPLRDAILDCSAWRAMSMGARALYVSIRRRTFNDGSNNGQVRFSNRQAQRELGSRDRYVTIWFRELQHYGFIVLASKGYLGGEGRGVASSWRVTELPSLENASHAEGYGATRDASEASINRAPMLPAALGPTAVAILVKRTDLPPAGSDWPKKLRPLPVRGAASIGMQSAAACLQVPVEADRPLQRARVAPDGSQNYGPSAAVITPPVYIAPAETSTDAARLLREKVATVVRRRRRELQLISRKLNGGSP